MSFLTETGLYEVWTKCLAKFALLSHNHAGSDINSGTVAIARGGTNASTEGAAADNLKVVSLGPGTSIPSNANLNTYNTVGNYYCSSNVTAATLTGTPSDLNGKMFLMKVGLSSGTNYNFQEIIRYDDGQRWYRYNTNGTTGTTWSEWVAYSSGGGGGGSVPAHTHDADDIDQGILNIGRMPIDDIRSRLFNIYRLALTSDITTSATTTKVTLTNVTSAGTDSVFSTSSNGIKVSKSGKYLVSGQIYHSLAASNHSGTLAVGLNGNSTYILKSGSKSYGTTSGNDCIVLPPTLVDLAANDVLYLYYAGTSGDKIVGATASTGSKYGTYLQLQRVA